MNITHPRKLSNILLKQFSSYDTQDMSKSSDRKAMVKNRNHAHSLVSEFKKFMKGNQKKLILI